MDYWYATRDGRAPTPRSLISSSYYLLCKVFALAKVKLIKPSLLTGYGPFTRNANIN